MKTKNVPAPSKVNLLRQVCQFIPEFLVPKLARETGVDKKVRKFNPWSHVISLLYAQLPRRIGLNDVCDALGLHSGLLSTLRGATPPSRNTLSHANKVRPAEWPRSSFGRCSNTWASSRPGSSAAGPGNDLPGSSSARFTWSTRRRSS